MAELSSYPAAAVSGSASVGQIIPDLKQNFVESKYVSKNPNLIKILIELANHDYRIYRGLYDKIRANEWKKFDTLIKEYSGNEYFFLFLKQLLLYKYFLPEGERITRKQFEIAMGIQQVRWMVDEENCKQMERYTVKEASFTYWKDIPANEKSIIQKTIYDNIQRKIIDSKLRAENLDAFFSGTVWYDVFMVDENGNRTHAGSWSGFGSIKSYYPLPETLNFSSIACIYTPKLVFGSLSDTSLLKFIILTSQRPYAAHLPDAKSNLCSIHLSKHCIVANWRHDFHHSASGDCKYGFETIERNCKLPQGTVSEDTLVADLKDDNSNLSRCLEATQKSLSEFDKATAKIEMNLQGETNISKKYKNIYKEESKLPTRHSIWVRGLNDSGIVWHKQANMTFQGGGKRHYKKTRKIVKSIRKRKQTYKSPRLNKH